MRVLLFENRAHLRSGHRPLWVAELAEELHRDGHEVHVVTSQGWAFSSDGRMLEGTIEVHRTARSLRLATWLAERMVDAGRSHWSQGWGRAAAVVGGTARQVAVLAAVRIGAHRVGRPKELVVIVLSMELRFMTAVLLAPRKARWTVYEHTAPGPLHQSTPMLTRLISRLAAAVERRRQRGGGYVRLAVNNAPAGAAWERMHPWVRFAVAPAAGQRAMQPASRADARRELGLPPDARVALMFGSAHPSKDVETVLLAFSAPDPPAHLVLAGVGYRARIQRLRARVPELDLHNITVIEGYATAEHKHLLHSAADQVILSFAPDNAMDSGTLNDAVAYGLPVACSDTPGVADLVREFGLGCLFARGEPAQLRAAATSAASFTVDPDARARYLSRYSPSALARNLLQIASRS